MESELKISSQMLKGILEGCILIVISRETVYGYEMNKKLQAFGFSPLSEGTIYPLLLKLQNKGLIESELRLSPDGPKRKYFSLSDAGQLECERFIQQWRILRHSVDQLIEGGGSSDEGTNS